jgi:hypothetical protein
MARNNAAAEGEEGQAENQGGVQFEDGQSYTFNMRETEEDSGFAPLPVGTYLVTIEQVEFKMSKSSGSPMWSLTYAVAEGEFAEKNRKIFDIISLKPEQRGRVKRFINRVAPELAELEVFDPKAIAEGGSLVGRNLKVRLDIETTEEYGARNRVKDHFAPGAAGAGGGTFNMGG